MLISEFVVATGLSRDTVRYYVPGFVAAGSEWKRRAKSLSVFHHRRFAGERSDTGRTVAWFATQGYRGVGHRASRTGNRRGAPDRGVESTTVAVGSQGGGVGRDAALPACQNRLGACGRTWQSSGFQPCGCGGVSAAP